MESPLKLVSSKVFHYMKLFYSIVIVCFVKLDRFVCTKKNAFGHCQKEDAKSAYTEKRAKNDRIEISVLIFMLTTWEYTSNHKITVQHCKFKKFDPNS